MTVRPEDLNYAQAWKPEAKDLIAGEVTEISSRGSEFGTYPIITLKVQNGTEEGGKEIPAGEERAIHAFHTALRNQLGAIAPQAGAELAILKKGLKVVPEGRDYEDYRVKDMNGGGSFDWGQESRSTVTVTPISPEASEMLNELLDRFRSSASLSNDVVDYAAASRRGGIRAPMNQNSGMKIPMMNITQ